MADLAGVIKSIESGGNPHALRFEPDAYANWNWVPAMDRIKAKHACSEKTARMIGCTSWGLYQIMGINIFDPRLPAIDPVDVIDFVNDVGLQEAAFTAFLNLRGINFALDDLLADQDKLRIFAITYNGSRDPDAYAALIRQHAALA